MKKVLFLGQAPAKPGSKHDVPGTYLHDWLTKLGLSDEDIAQHCHFYALVGAFPGVGKNGHLPPTKADIALHRPFLKNILADLQPDVIVPVGKLAIAELNNDKNAALEQYIGRRFFINPFGALPAEIICVPLPHPSGRSTWNHVHKHLVTRALTLLKQEAL